MLVRAQPSQLNTCPGRPTARTPVPQTGNAGSTPARGAVFCPQTRDPQERSPRRGRHGSRPLRVRPLALALGRVWRCDPAVYRMRRVRFPSGALLAVAQRTSTRLLPWPTEVRLLPASCVARLVASPRAVNPWSRVQFPGDAPLVAQGRESAGADPRPRGAEPLRRRGFLRRRAGRAGAALIRRAHAWFDSTVVDFTWL
jgi:hypothetical protein